MCGHYTHEWNLITQLKFVVSQMTTMDWIGAGIVLIILIIFIIDLVRWPSKNK